MNRGKLIVIEGTDSSGKETQSKLLYERLKSEGHKVYKTSFPMYDTPTGRIVGGPYLGKPSISEGYFKEGASNVDGKVASLYYAADRYYNIYLINTMLSEGVNVILDRYTFSNMAHQAGKEKDESKRKELYKFLEELEFKLLQLPVPDLSIFLYVPSDVSFELKKDREETDQHEDDIEHLKLAEKAYFEIAEIYGFETIQCVSGKKLRSREDISEELTSLALNCLKEKTRL